MAAIDWNTVITTVITALGGTAAVVAALAFVARGVFDHFLKLDLEEHKAALMKETNAAKAYLENDLKQKSDAIVITLQEAADKHLEVFKSDLATRSAKDDRIREVVLRWSNPILSAIEDLEHRLDNILNQRGYPMLSSAAKPVSGWSARYDYFMPSTVYFFCQYFFWIRSLEEKLSFELFEKHEVKDKFLARIYAASSKLGDYPLEDLKNIEGDEEDRQIFKLEQRALGELMDVAVEGEPRCMGYADFMDNWSDPEVKKKLIPVTSFLEGVNPTNEHRWRRLELLLETLQGLGLECRSLLRLDHVQS
jgi:hypothetical protein